MTSMLPLRVAFEPLRLWGYTSIDENYTAIPPALEFPVRILLVQNFTNQALLFSLDGDSDHFLIPENGSLLWDFCSNKTLEQGFFIMAGGYIWVRATDSGSVPTSGSVIVSTVYGSGPSLK